MDSKLKRGEGTKLIAIIGDQDTVTGFLLAGIGERSVKGQTNYLIVDDKTTAKEIQETFRKYLASPLISTILVTQNVSERFLKEAIANHMEVYPVVLEIPSKDSPYDPKKDIIMQRAHRQLYGSDI